MRSLDGYCQGLTRCWYAKKLCRYFATDTVTSHFTQGPKLPALSTTSCICKISSAPRCFRESSPQPSHHRVASAAILPAKSRRAGRELSRRGFIIAGVAARRVLLVPIVQVSGRGGRTAWDGTMSTTLQASSQRGRRRTPTLLRWVRSQTVSTMPPIRLHPPIPGNLESGFESSTKSHITNLLQTMPEWNVNVTYARKLKICI